MFVRPALRLFLALAVALASIHSGIGRAEARGAVQLVICAEGTVQTVTIGADGQPVRHLYPCPDCVLGGFALAAALVPLAAPLARGRRMARPAGRGHPVSRRVPAARARGPPGPV